MTLALLAVFSTAMAQQGQRRVEPAAIPVRYTEGTAHGFLELRAATGALLAHGDVLQVARGEGIETRMVFHFPDASVFEEAVTFTQHGVFTMQSYHLVQSGPAFAEDLEVTLSRSGQYVVKTKSHKDGRGKEYTGKLDLPPDVYNGLNAGRWPRPPQGLEAAADVSDRGQGLRHAVAAAPSRIQSASTPFAR